MHPDESSESPPCWRRRLLVLAVLLGAIALRLWGFAGLAGSDDLAYTQTARRVIDGTFRPDNPGFEARYGIVLPTALSIAVFGLSEHAVLVFPFLCSLAILLCVRVLGERIGGWRAGFLALLLLSTSPLDVWLATNLLPDGPVSAAIALTFVLALAGTEDGVSPRRRGLLLFLGGMVLAFGILVKESAGFVAPALLLVLLRTARGARRAACAAFFAGTLVLLLPAVLYNVHAVGHPWPVLAPPSHRVVDTPLPWNPYQYAGFGTLVWLTTVRIPGWLLNPMGGSIVFFGGIGIIGVAGSLVLLLRDRRRAWSFVAWWISYYLVMFYGFWVLWRIRTGRGFIIEQQIRYLAPMLPAFGILGGAWLARVRFGAVFLAGIIAFQLVCAAVLRQNEALPRQVPREAARHVAELPPGKVYTDARTALLLGIYVPGSDRLHPASPLPQELEGIPTGAYVLIDERRMDWLTGTYGGRPTWQRTEAPASWILDAEWKYPAPVNLRARLFRRAVPDAPVQSILLYHVR